MGDEDSFDNTAYYVRQQALDHAMKMHGEYTRDAGEVIKAAKTFEAYLRGGESLDERSKQTQT